MTMASGLYVVNFIDILDATQLAVDLSLTTHKIAFYSNTKTPNFSSDTGYSATNEVTGTNLPAGGITLATLFAGASVAPTVTDSPAGTLMYDFTNDISIATVTASAIRGMILYADALAGDNNIAAVNFGADYSPSAGTLAIVLASGGLFNIDFVP